jgi:hypothetical protein
MQKNVRITWSRVATVTSPNHTSKAPAKQRHRTPKTFGGAAAEDGGPPAGVRPSRAQETSKSNLALSWKWSRLGQEPLLPPRTAAPPAGVRPSSGAGNARV